MDKTLRQLLQETKDQQMRELSPIKMATTEDVLNPRGLTVPMWMADRMVWEGQTATMEWITTPQAMDQAMDTTLTGLDTHGQLPNPKPITDKVFIQLQEISHLTRL
jgi:hypothetical protein